MTGAYKGAHLFEIHFIDLIESIKPVGINIEHRDECPARRHHRDNDF